VNHKIAVEEVSRVCKQDLSWIYISCTGLIVLPNYFGKTDIKHSITDHLGRQYPSDIGNLKQTWSRGFKIRHVGVSNELHGAAHEYLEKVRYMLVCPEMMDHTETRITF